MICKKLLFLWSVFILLSTGVRAQVYSNRIVKRFAGSGESTIEVFNKYGKVHVVTWAKDSVKFEVDYRITASDDKKLSKLKNDITFDFTSTNHYTVARTKFEKSGGIFSDVVQTIIPSNSVIINYIVYVPESANLRIENKFGDVYIDDFNGNISLNLSNGALKANNLNGNTSLSLSSADAVVNNIKRGAITMRYSDIEITNLQKIEMDTKFSNVIVNKANDMKITSRRDNYNVSQVATLSGVGDFTKMKITYLSGEINFSNKYYSILIEDINKDFDLVNLDSEITDIELVFQSGAAYNLDVTHHEEVQLTYPEKLAKLETKELDPEKRLLLTYGTVGKTVDNSPSKVKIVAEKKCIIDLKQK